VIGIVARGVVALLPRRGPRLILLLHRGDGCVEGRVDVLAVERFEEPLADDEIP